MAFFGNILKGTFNFVRGLLRGSFLFFSGVILLCKGGRAEGFKDQANAVEHLVKVNPKRLMSLDVSVPLFFTVIFYNYSFVR